MNHKRSKPRPWKGRDLFDGTIGVQEVRETQPDGPSPKTRGNRGKRKPYAVQQWVEHGWGTSARAYWWTLGRYATARDRDNALAAFRKNDYSAFARERKLRATGPDVDEVAA